MAHESTWRHLKLAWRRLLRLYMPRLAVFAALSLATTPALASKVRLLNLEEMVERADRIVSGRCIETRAEFDRNAGLSATLVTIHVDLQLKGSSPTNLSYKTHPLRGVGNGRAQDSDGFGCNPGDELILLLYGESAVGFTSPIGLGQGKFIVSTDKHGRRVARNAVGNEGLLRGLSTMAQQTLGSLAAPGGGAGELSPEQLLDLIRALRDPRPHGAGPSEAP